MLNLLDNLLRAILMQNVPALREVRQGQPSAAVVDDQVRFEPPDELWQNYVRNTVQRNALSVYLVDLRENRQLRTNERARTIDQGLVYSTPAPARLDCHYLISALSPSVQLTPQIEPSLDEHILLYQAVAALLRSAPLNPSRVYPSSSLPLNAWPAQFRNADLPAVIAPSEGFPKLAEFWGTMGQDHRWRAALYLVVTIPVELVQAVSGPMVTTRIVEYRQLGAPQASEVWIQIGGQVLDARSQVVAPLAGAWVGLETVNGQPVRATNADDVGRFVFGELAPGRYQLRARAAGLGELNPPRVVDIPSASGEYDLRFV